MANRWHQAGARISVRDVHDLNDASEALATAADTIKRINPSWSGTVIALLIRANETIVRIQNKGAAAFARYLERHGVKEPLQATEAENQADDPNRDQEINSEEQ